MTARVLDVPTALAHARTQSGTTLARLSRATPLLVVFVRGFDTVRCLESLTDVIRLRAKLESEGARIVLVHTVTDVEAVDRLRPFSLHDTVRVSDPGGWLDMAFRFRRGGPREWAAHELPARPAGTALPPTDIFGPPIGERQPPAGIFLVHREAIVQEYHHRLADDGPHRFWAAVLPRPSPS
jgi:hypothetical protein